MNKAYDRNLESAADGQIDVIHGITGLMDLNLNEFHSMLGYRAPEEHMKGLKVEDVLTGEGLARTVDSGARDWRDEGAVTTVKD